MEVAKYFEVLVIIVFFSTTSAQSPRRSVSQGVVVGKTVLFDENEFLNITKYVDVFQGIPYAEPPERFRPPVIKAPWSGDYNATAFKPACAQAPSFYFPIQDEDCLYLNVYAPNPKPKGAATMVYIHGGSFASGTAMTYDFYGVPLVAVGDVIVVVINYRVGVFATFTTKSDAAPGNIGMLDQVAALQWIKSNIEEFGGDSNKITIFGESAGSASVSFHLLSKLSRGLFQQAIMQSGTAFSGWAFEDNPEKEVENAKKIGQAFGCNLKPLSDLVACLQAIESSELWAVADQVYGQSYRVNVDGAFLEDTPMNLYADGDFKKASILAGTTRDEGTFELWLKYFWPYAYSETPPPIKQSELEEFLGNTLIAENILSPDSMDILLDAVLHEYTDWSIADDPNSDYFQSAVDAVGDFSFKCPTDAIIRAHVSAGDTVYRYIFNYPVTTSSYFHVVGVLPFTPWLGAGHAEELFYVWGGPFIDQLDNVHGQNVTDDEKTLAVNMMRFWTNFAKTGNPSQSDADVAPNDGSYGWPEFTIPELRHKILDVQLGEGRADRASECQFWNTFFPKLKFSTQSVDDSQRQWRHGFSNWMEKMQEWRKDFASYKNGCS
ncbi:cholinesterase 1-like isoform X1 [Lytechinus variegatus]|uniref:cholinesterase 1-like isoform X1 n=1 Tax=Lytechinus variegatus TaxID=7654 RepID=UPI001BB20C93|nr:cholinesterase 1-like isoform X1 [Lytechinus variegatus]